MRSADLLCRHTRRLLQRLAWLLWERWCKELRLEVRKLLRGRLRGPQLGSPMDCWHRTCGAATQAASWGSQLAGRGQLNWVLLLLPLLLLLVSPPLRLLLEQAGKLAVQLRAIQGTLLHCCRVCPCMLPLAPGLVHGRVAAVAAANQRWMLSVKCCQGWRAAGFKRAKPCRGHNACRQQGAQHPGSHH